MLTLLSRLLFHYWATRRVSTGIAIVTLSLESFVDLVHYIVTRALNFDYVSIPIFILAIIAYVLIILKQIHLVIKPDFKLATVAVGDVKVPAPVAVRFRSATVEEKASYKLDGGFDWRLRILVSPRRQCPFSHMLNMPILDRSGYLLGPVVCASPTYRHSAIVREHGTWFRRSQPLGSESALGATSL